MCRCRIEFARVRFRQSADIARKLDTRCLHAQANSKIGNFVLSRVTDRLQHAFNAALAESARNQNAVVTGQLLFASLLAGFQSLGFNPVHA